MKCVDKVWIYGLDIGMEVWIISVVGQREYFVTLVAIARV